VFVTRYLDLVTHFYSIYNTVLKIIFIATTAKIVCTIHYDEPVKSTYDKNYDTFPHWKYAVAPVAIISLITDFFNDQFDDFQEDIVRFLWMFSIYLEAVAIVPQLVLLQQSGECDHVMGLYIFFMGAYRALYILNWIYHAILRNGSAVVTGDARCRHGCDDRSARISSSPRRGTNHFENRESRNIASFC
jgi:ER lumen protein retaining receptor